MRLAPIDARRDGDSTIGHFVTIQTKLAVVRVHTIVPFAFFLLARYGRRCQIALYEFEPVFQLVTKTSPFSGTAFQPIFRRTSFFLLENSSLTSLVSTTVTTTS